MSARNKGKKGIAARLAAVSGGTGTETPVVKRTEENDKEIDKLLHSTVPRVVEKLAEVADAFSVFDPSNKNMIDVREVGCLVRALGNFSVIGREVPQHLLSHYLCCAQYTFPCLSHTICSTPKHEYV
jgi:hypothetical protein